MLQKHVIAIPKPWSNLVSFGSHLHEIIAKAGSAMAVPTGYQDESGFHFGAEPAEREVKWDGAREAGTGVSRFLEIRLD
jgi:hypothetical protein